MLTYDTAGRLVAASNVLGAFSYAYDAGSLRLVSKTLPNGQTTSRSYGSVVQDLNLLRVTHQNGAVPISEFLYSQDIPASRIMTWSQQAGAQAPDIYSFGYDSANQLLSATVTNSGAWVNAFAYSYDAAANRLTEQAGASSYTAVHNALNQLSTTTAPSGSRTNEWDAANRLTAVNAGNQRTEFTYDGLSRVVGIRQLVNGSEVSHRLFGWNDNWIAEERDTNGITTKRFLAQGVQVLTGPNAGNYYYSRDHLGSIRELTDGAGNVRARYAYDPFGRRTKVSGDLDADFGFAAMFWCGEANLYLTHFRAYDPGLGRWLSRDPLRNAELLEGPNLYAYAANNPANLTDPSGLSAGEMMLRGIGELLGPSLGESSGKVLGELMLRPVGDIELWNPGLTQMEWWETMLEEGSISSAERIEFTYGLYNARLRDMWEKELINDEQYFRRLADIRTPLARPAPPRVFPSAFTAAGEFIGAGFTILSMTDCDTAEGIFALVRVSKGGLLNKYENRMMKDVKRLEGW